MNAAVADEPAAKPAASAKTTMTRFNRSSPRREKSGRLAAPVKLPRNPKRRLAVSERVHPTHRYGLQRRAGEAGRPTRRNSTGVLAVGGNAVAARAEVVVRAGVIGLPGIYRVPVALLVEMVLIADGVHVGRVVDRAYPWIARRLSGTRPADVDVVLTRDFLCQRQPGGVVLPLVEVRIRGLPGQPLEDHADDGIGRKHVLNPNLRRSFIDDTN